MKPRWTRLLLAAIGLLALVYFGDYLSIAYRIPSGRAQFGSVQVQTLLAIPRKDRKTEYVASPPEEQPCAYSLFPRLGLPPCWYESRHAVQQVNY